jgi:hypothetical protein
VDFAAVQYYLNDLPPNFKRSGPTFQWWQNSLGTGITQWTSAVDGVMSQTSFVAAQWAWLDLWGNLFNVIRESDQTDKNYKSAIQNMLMSRGATPVTLRYYMDWRYGVSSTVDENFTDTSWSLNINNVFPGGNYDKLASNLGQFRPSGVPFAPFYIATGGNYLSTVNFLGASRVPGSWLTSAKVSQAFTLNAGTTNSVAKIPTTFLTDPTLNPGLAIAPVPVPLSVFTTPNNTPPSATALGTDAYTNFTIVAQDPNGAVAGSVNDKAFVSPSRLLYICTTAGTNATAVWTPIDEVVGSVL